MKSPDEYSCQPDDQSDKESLKPFAALALPSPAAANADPKLGEDRSKYRFSVEQAAAYFQDAGYIVASRTLTGYCHTNRFECKKFSCGGVRRWFVKEKSLAKHLKLLKMNYPQSVSAGKPPHAEANTEASGSNPTSTPSAYAKASDSTEQLATAMYDVKYVKMLEEQVSLKDSQIKSLLKQADELTLVTRGLGGLLSRANEPPHESNEGMNNDYQT